MGLGIYRQSDDPKRFGCVYCPFRSHGFRTLEMHVLVQHGDDTFVRVPSKFLNFTCEVCHVTAGASVDDLRRHQAKFHGGLTPNNFAFKYPEAHRIYWEEEKNKEAKKTVEEIKTEPPADDEGESK